MVELDLFEPGEVIFTMHRDEMHAYRVDESGLTRVDLMAAVEVARQEEPGEDAIKAIPSWESKFQELVAVRPINLGSSQGYPQQQP